MPLPFYIQNLKLEHPLRTSDKVPGLLFHVMLLVVR